MSPGQPRRTGGATPAVPARHRLWTTARAYRSRASARRPADLAYAVYIAVLLTAATVFPLIRALVLQLSSEPVAAALVGPEAGRVVAGTLAVAGLAAVAVSRVVGPVALTPFFVLVRTATDMPRSASLAAPLARTVGALGGAMAAASAVALSAAVLAGHLPWSAVVLPILTMALSGVVLATLWLAAAGLDTRGVRRLMLIALLAAVAALPPAPWWLSPWGWAGQAWPSSDIAAVATGLVALAAALCLVATPALLRRLPVARLEQDASQWHAFRAGVTAGDLSGAAAGWRARPSVGRHWPIVSGSRPVLRQWRVDLGAAARTPERQLLGFVTATVGAVLMIVAAGSPAGWVIGAGGAVLCYLGLGVWCDGLRHAAAAGGPLPLFGHSDLALQALHLWAPASMAVLCTGVAALVCLTFGFAVGAAAGVTWIALVALVALVLVLLRWYDSSKPPLPLSLLTPAPSPAGDLSSLVVAAYQVDGVMMAAVLGALSVALLG